MLIEKRSILDGKKYVMDIPITEEQLQRYERGDVLIQDLCPDMSPEHREFLISGITPSEWKKTFG